LQDGGVRACQRGARLLELTVELGCVEEREQLPRLHVVTHVRQPLGDVPAGTAVHAGGLQRFDAAGQ
jgi:hypothetical protein